MPANPNWPSLPLSAWEGSCETLYRWSQIVGKIKLALTPMVNHWWNVVLYVNSRGFTTSPIPYQNRTFEIIFDFIAHRLLIHVSDGQVRHVELRPVSVATFYAELMGALRELGIDVHIWSMPCEIENAVSFEQDHEHAQYDPVWVHRFWQALVAVDRVLSIFRSRFIGKASPVHFFWGGFDLAVTRFSGRPAPKLKGKWPNVAESIMQEAYSHEVSSCGFWPGNGGFGKPAIYVYAYPEPNGLGVEPLRTPGAAYHADLGQFILSYEEVANATDPEGMLLGFCRRPTNAPPV